MESLSSRKWFLSSTVACLRSLHFLCPHPVQLAKLDAEITQQLRVDPEDIKAIRPTPRFGSSNGSIVRSIVRMLTAQPIPFSPVALGIAPLAQVPKCLLSHLLFAHLEMHKIFTA